MDNKKHAAIGAIFGLCGYLLYKDIKQKPIDWLEAILSMIGGAFAGILPDILEPATSPNPRSLFHSAISLLILAYGNQKVWQNENLTEGQKTAISTLSAAYGSHLLAGSTTEKGLPLLF